MTEVKKVEDGSTTHSYVNPKYVNVAKQAQPIPQQFRFEAEFQDNEFKYTSGITDLEGFRPYTPLIKDLRENLQSLGPGDEDLVGRVYNSIYALEAKIPHGNGYSDVSNTLHGLTEALRIRLEETGYPEPLSTQAQPQEKPQSIEEQRREVIVMKAQEVLESLKAAGCKGLNYNVPGSLEEAMFKSKIYEHSPGISFVCSMIATAAKNQDYDGLKKADISFGKVEERIYKSGIDPFADEILGALNERFLKLGYKREHQYVLKIDFNPESIGESTTKLEDPDLKFNMESPEQNENEPTNLPLEGIVDLTHEIE